MADPKIYDRAKWHYEGDDYPAGLDQRQAYVLTGLYIGWLMDRGLISDDFAEDFEDDIRDFKARKITGPEVYWRSDGVLADDVLNAEGRKFTKWYFADDDPKFYDDVDETLGGDLPSLYQIEDTWANYEQLREVIDRRYEKWSKKSPAAKTKR